MGRRQTEAETVRERGAREWCAAACERESESEKCGWILSKDF